MAAVAAGQIGGVAISPAEDRQLDRVLRGRGKAVPDRRRAGSHDVASKQELARLQAICWFIVGVNRMTRAAAAAYKPPRIAEGACIPDDASSRIVAPSNVDGRCVESCGHGKWSHARQKIIRGLKDALAPGLPIKRYAIYDGRFIFLHRRRAGLRFRLCCFLRLRRCGFLRCRGRSFFGRRGLRFDGRLRRFRRLCLPVRDFAARVSRRSFRESGRFCFLM